MKSQLFLAALLLVAGPLTGQKKDVPDPQAAEEEALRRGMGEAGSAPSEMIRALEKHLARFPKSNRREDIERAILKAAIDSRDNERILRYGEPHLKEDPSDLLVLERVTRLLVAREDKASNERGLAYAKQFEQGIRELSNQKPEGGRLTGSLKNDLDRGLGRAFTFQARAQGHLGSLDQAVAMAKKSFETYPAGEPAAEIARWLVAQGKPAEAMPHFADAFAFPDPRFTDEDRLRIRNDMGAQYRKLHGSEEGMGDLMLGAYDRARAMERERDARLRAIDPNYELTNAMDFTLTGVHGDTLDLETLRGKVVVLDFWATWCGPCRAQYPMYEQVKATFKDRDDVVFLGINTDENREAVKPFLEEQKWKKAVYFEDGLSQLLHVSSIPTTMIFNRQGELATRFNGFVPERFIEMLTQRIEELLAQQPQ